MPDFEIAWRDVSLTVRRYAEADRIVMRRDARIAYSVIHQDESLHEWVYEFQNRDVAKAAFKQLASSFPDVPPGVGDGYHTCTSAMRAAAGA